MTVSFKIAAEPTFEDYDATYFPLIVLFILYFAAVPTIVFLRHKNIIKSEKTKISKKQLWGQNKCCFGLCCGKKNFGSINSYVDLSDKKLLPG
jgi:hypothetical protein